MDCKSEWKSKSRLIPCYKQISPILVAVPVKGIDLIYEAGFPDCWGRLVPKRKPSTQISDYKLPLLEQYSRGLGFRV